MINLSTMDVYDDSPTLVTSWLTIMPKISIFIFLLQLLVGIDVYSISQLIFVGLNKTVSLTSFLNLNTYNYIYIVSINLISKNILTQLLLISSLLSLIIGAIVGLSQIRIKRLLA